jgi:hypothetical protein
MEGLKHISADLHPAGSRPVKIGNCVIGFVTGKKRSGRPWALATQRLSEIEKVMRSRHGSFVGGDDASSYLAPLASAVANERRATMQKDGREASSSEIAAAVIAACRRWLPSLSLDEIEDEAHEVAESPRHERADAIGKALGVSFTERQALGLRTIGCRDLNKRQRKSAVKAAKVERQKAKRRAAGVKPRAEYEGNSVQALAASWGVSRQTIYDWRKRGDLRGFDRSEAHISKPILASHMSSMDETDGSRCDGAGPSRPTGAVTKAGSKSFNQSACDVRSALEGPAPSLALIPAGISDPDRYQTVMAPVIAGLRGDPIGHVLRVASSAIRRGPVAANLNLYRAALAPVEGVP